MDGPFNPNTWSLPSHFSSPIVCRSGGCAWSAKQISDSPQVEETSAVDIYSLQCCLIQTAAFLDSPGGVQSSLVTPDSAVFQKATAGLRRINLEGLCWLYLMQRGRSLTERIKIGAGYYSNYAPSHIVQSKLPTHSNVNRDVEQKQYGFTNKGLKMYDGTNNQEQRRDSEMLTKLVGRKISAAEKRKFLINTLFDLKDSKESVYGTLDAWVAMEPTFPLASLRQALVVLEKHEQWHRIVQVLKWILSKGQGNTMGTYKLLITALEKDNRAEEAHKIWKGKIGHDLHSVSWDFCDLMLSIYYRNNMLDRLVKLFRRIESYGRKPPRKSIVRKVADAYEVLGLKEEKDKLLNEYSYLFDKSSDENKRRYKHSKKAKKEDKKENSKVESLNSMAVDSGPSDDQTQKQCSQNS